MTSEYREAAGVLDVVLSRKRGLRAAAMAPEVKNKRKVLALVTRTLQFQSILEKAVKAVPGAAQKLSTAIPGRAMRLLMLYDLLFGQGKISGGGKAARMVKSLKEELEKVLPARDELRPITTASTTGSHIRDNAEQTMPEMPRYVRVNTLKMTLEEGEIALRAHVRSFLDSTMESHGRGIETNSSSSSSSSPPSSTPSEFSLDKCVYRDPHIPNLLCVVVPSSQHWRRKRRRNESGSNNHRMGGGGGGGGRNMEFHSLPEVQSGALILQDKASCFSAEACVGAGSRFQGGDVLDACAAPGNKTTHLAALLAASSKPSLRSASRVIAFDRDPERLGILAARCANAGCGNVGDGGDAGTGSVVGGSAASTKAKIAKKKGKRLPREKLGGQGNNERDHPLVTVQLADFLSVDVAAPLMDGVRAILLDPSCSGSGIVGNLDRLVDRASEHEVSAAHVERQDTVNSGGSSAEVVESRPTKKLDAKQRQRIEALANFQKAALRKALSFPQVSRVVYSTCSVHDEENEHVVASVLGRGSLLTANIADGGDSNDSNDRDDGGDDGARDTETVSSGMHGAVEASSASVAPAFRLRTVLPQWPRRGRAVGGLSLAESRCLVRCDPEQDRTHGFFVACFERHSGDSDESRDGDSDESEDSRLRVQMESANMDVGRKRKRSAGTGGAASSPQSMTNAHVPSTGVQSMQEPVMRRSKNEKRKQKKMRRKVRLLEAQEQKSAREANDEQKETSSSNDLSSEISRAEGQMPSLESIPIEITEIKIGAPL